MSFQIGQFRRNQLSPSAYTEEIAFSQSYKPSKNENAISAFEDVWLSLANGVNLEPIYSYYLQIKVKNQISINNNNGQTFKVELVNGNSFNISDNVQILRTFSVDAGSESYTIFELAFAPNSTYNNIVFELIRTKEDYQEPIPRKMEIEVLKFCKVNNILDNLSGVDSLIKMGLQGPPGLLFVLNGEEMRLGRSGVFELYHDTIRVTSIGFILKESEYTHDLDYFIMDYKY